MMVGGFALGLLFGLQDIQKTTVVTASLFKNGYAVVVREAPLTSTETMVEGLPMASLGTLWITASPGIKLEEVVRTERETETENNASSLDEVMSSNVGKRVTIRLPNDKSVSGVVQSASGTIIILTTDTGVEAVPKSLVQGVSGEGLSWKVKGKTKIAGLRIRARFESRTAGGKIVIVSLERGITWAPAYAVDISDSKRLSVVGKATILNDLGEVSGVEVRLITGFPNIPYITVFDPLTSGQSVDQFVSVLMNLGTPAELRQQLGQTLARNAMKADARGWEEAFEPSGLGGLQAEDLFFYRQPNVTLKRGERGYYVLFRAESDYEHIYTWDIGDPMEGELYKGLREGPGDVWHSLKFKNTSTQPWTSAPAVTFKDGEILGQDLISYTSIGAESLLKITKALDVRAEQSEEELSRERGAIKVNNIPTFDLVTLKGTLEISNRKTERIKIRITKELTGEVITADGEPSIKKTAKGLRDVNTRQRIEWVKDVDAGKSLVLTYTYKVYVSSTGR